MSSIIVYHHLGLGDHIMCHGIVREYCKIYDKVSIFSHVHNYSSVSFMFRDLKNLEIIKGSDNFAKKFINENKSKYDEVRLIGFEHLNRNSGIPLEKQFYDIANVPLIKKWESFYVERDLRTETELYQKYAPKENYLFLHEDIKRNYLINKKKINKNLKIFAPNNKLTENIFNYYTIIEKAKEIHVIDSSFMFMIDCLDYKNPEQKLFIHRYSRENNEWQLPVLKKDWTILLPEPSLIDPLKYFLERIYRTELPIIRHSIFKRVIRKFFAIMIWPMGRPQKPDPRALIRRYAPGKSFSELIISSKGTSILEIAKNAGATETSSKNIYSAEKILPSDIVFFSGEISENHHLFETFLKLRSVTKKILIFNVTLTKNKKMESVKPEQIRLLLKKSGFEIREEHIMPFGLCFVSKAI